MVEPPSEFHNYLSFYLISFGILKRRFNLKFGANEDCDSDLNVLDGLKRHDHPTTTCIRVPNCPLHETIPKTSSRCQYYLLLPRMLLTITLMGPRLEFRDHRHRDGTQVVFL